MMITSQGQEEYDVIIVGAGLMGSSTAYASACKKGKKVLLLEQFQFLHSKGSSHGTSRIFRLAYNQSVYTVLCKQSLQMWKEIEDSAKVSLLEMTGELDFVISEVELLDPVVDTLKEHGLDHEVLTAQEVNSKFPGLKLPSTAKGIFNPHAGILNPTEAMRSFQLLAKQHGAVLKDNAKVVEIQEVPSGGIQVLLESGEVFHSPKCVVTAGPWTKKLLSKYNIIQDTQIQPIATFGTYWKVPSDACHLYTTDKFPVFINYEQPWVYGIPMQKKEEGIKICRHDGPNVDPDERQKVHELPSKEMTSLKGFINDYFTKVDTTSPSKVDLCMYTITKSEDFIMDLLPVANPNTTSLVVGAGFSGHGAKMAPVIGEILSDLALEGTSKYPTQPFQLSIKYIR